MSSPSQPAYRPGEMTRLLGTACFVGAFGECVSVPRGAEKSHPFRRSCAAFTSHGALLPSPPPFSEHITPPFSEHITRCSPSLPTSFLWTHHTELSPPFPFLWTHHTELSLLSHLLSLNTSHLLSLNTSHEALPPFPPPFSEHITPPFSEHITPPFSEHITRSSPSLPTSFLWTHHTELSFPPPFYSSQKVLMRAFHRGCLVELGPRHLQKARPCSTSIPPSGTLRLRILAQIDSAARTSPVWGCNDAHQHRCTIHSVSFIAGILSSLKAEHLYYILAFVACSLLQLHLLAISCAFAKGNWNGLIHWDTEDNSILSAPLAEESMDQENGPEWWASCFSYQIPKRSASSCPTDCIISTETLEQL